MTAVSAALAHLGRPLQRLHWAGWVLRGLAGAALVLALAAWGLRLGGSPVLVLVAWPVVLLLLGAAVFVAAGGASRWRAAALARRLEGEGHWRRGSLTGLLGPMAPGTSDDLSRVADEALGREVAEGGGGALRPARADLGARTRLAAVLLALGLAGLAAAKPFQADARPLWAPRGALEALRAPIALEANVADVDRGGSVVLTVRAVGADAAIIHQRAPGEPWHEAEVALDAEGTGRLVIGPLEEDRFVFATRGGRSSDTLALRVRLPAFLGSVEVMARYPAYLRMEPEPLPLGSDTLALPVGTVLETRGLATLPLTEAAWLTESRRHALAVEGSGFTGAFTPPRSGRYALALRTASGAPLAGDTAVLQLRLVADAPPQVAIPVPGADTVAPADLRIPLVLDATDDHGLARVRVLSRRVSRLGQASDPVTLDVDLPADAPDRILLPLTLDARERGLLPGDTLRYWAEVTDNAPGGQVARSVEFALWVPTLAEQREAARAAGESLQARLDSLEARATELERRTEDLARARARSDQGGQRTEALDYRDAQRAQAVAQEQAELIEQAEEAAEALEALQRAAEAGGMSDPAWQERIRELREQLERALSPELRQRLAELQRALESLDAERTREALEQLAERQQQLREALERSQELFRRAALEGDLNRLEADAREIARDMESWAERMAQADSAAAARRADELARQADSLATGLEEAGREAAAEQPAQAAELGRAADQARRAAAAMEQAGQQAQQGSRQQAARSGEQAAASMEPVGDAIEQARRQMAAEWMQQVAESLDRTISETARLTDRQVALEARLAEGAVGLPALRAEQGALEEGVRQLLAQVARTAGSNALVSNRIGVALEQARRQMATAREALTSATPDARGARQAVGEAAELLTFATYEMLRSRDDVTNAQSGSGLEEAMQQMAQLAQQQGQLSQQSAGMLPMPGPGMQGELQRLAGEQRALAEALERMRAEGRVPGAGELAEEAGEVARRLEAGRLDRATVERQERLFRRMLDAGRTLEGDERDDQKERQSTSATGVDPRLPDALQRAGSRSRMPTWAELQHLGPEERRLVIDYFRRLSEAP